jgi:hypothetical protein
MPMKSFRGKIQSGGLDQISLHTKNGSIGYKIKKLEVMPENYANATEVVLKVYSVPQATATNTIDFSDNTLLAAAFLDNPTAAHNYPIGPSVIFDNMIFNQDVYITAVDNSGSDRASNYYIEMEQVKLDLMENTVATLKDIRNITG